MLKVSDAFNSAFAAPDRELRARVTIGKTVYDSDDLTSINYDSGAMTGEQFSIGSTYMNSTKITFSHLVEGLKQLDEVLVEFGVLKPDGAVEYVKMGTFIVDDKIQMDRNNNTTTIECMDRMTMLGGAYVSKLTYPARIKDVAVEIANMAGVKANETSFARLSENKINQPTGYTYRDAIGLIAQFQMGFALFDRDGLLDIRTLQDNSFKIDPNQYFLKGLVKNETFFKLNGISCTVVTTSKDENGNETSKTTVLQSGSSSGAQIKLANNVMTQDVLDRMYEALKFTNYYPFSLNWNGNPAVEAGDWLTVEDLQGNEFKVPNMSYTLTYNGGLTATSKADTSVSSPATYSYGGAISNIVNEIGGRESAEGNHIYEGTEDQEPTLSKEGDLWYKHVGPDTEERIYKDGKWEFLTSTKTANDAADAANKASKEAEEAKNQANKAVDGADDAVTKAGFANDTATQAKSDAASALQKALDAYNHGDQIKTGLTTDIDAVKGQVNLKANQVDVDKLGGRVTNAEAQIKLQADQIALSVSKTELTNVLGSYATQTWTQGQIKTTADQIKLSVSQVQSNLDNLNIEDRNLYLGTKTMKGWQKRGNATLITLDGEYVTDVGGDWAALWNPVHLEKGKKYKWSIDYKGIVNTGIQLYLYVSPINGAAVIGNIIARDLQTVWNRAYGEFVSPFTGDVMVRSEVANGDWETLKHVYTRHIKLSQSDKDTGWSEAPEDSITDIEFSELQLTVNGIQGTVQNKADQSQVTQLAGQITSVVDGLGQKNLLTNSTFDDFTNWSHATGWDYGAWGYNGSKGAILDLKAGTGWAEAVHERVLINGYMSYVSASVQRNYNRIGADGVLGAEIRFRNTDGLVIKSFSLNGIPPALNGWHLIKADMVQIPSGSAYVEMIITGKGDIRGIFSQPMLVANAPVGPYSQNDVSQSQITQTRNMINLRVEKDKIVNQINISPEGILIDGQKVHITGQTTIDNAVIKDAMISDIKADKITAGTLNAANVNVINLNANNITTGTIKGANLSMNLNTGEVLFQKGSIKSANGNLNLDISKGTMAVINEDKSGFYFEDGKLVLNDGWLEGTSSQPKYGSLEYNANYFTVNGLAVKGTEGVTIGTPGYNPSMEMMFSSVKESGIAIDRKHLEMGSVGPTVISSGNEFFMNLLTKQPFIAVGTTADGNFMTTDKPGSRISLYAEYVHIKSAYLKTASGSANVIVAADGALVRSTSATKYKTDIIRTNIPDYGEKLLELPTATWTDIAETKRYRDNPTTQPKPTRNFGMIAEDLAEAGLEMLVVRGTDGELEGINYDRIGPALIPVIAKLKNEVETLKQQLEEKTA
ncbi:hypothetical protein LCW_03590 [Latilactobacillus curvatus]|uniref:gp58-like family protein n=1 Tax=Latilactobacillus curvatus TaxID=28038 RepID=UPI000849F604|nr:gp58-like family protein [Latilactobacillus curvatus]AOO75204.1 hypothetical protein LCW_03590 [Latilactobacillus curvatus]